MKSMAEYTRDLLLTCPDLVGVTGLDMHIDFVDNVGDSYSLDSLPVDNIVTRYRGGAALMRYAFALTSVRESFDEADRMANVLHYEKLVMWMHEVTNRHQLIALDSKRQPLAINPTGNPYIAARDTDGTLANYQMTAEVIYYQGGTIT